MGKEIISEKQAISLIILFVINGSIVLPTGAEAGNDLWLAIIIALLFVILIAELVYSRIHNSFPGKNLFDILEINFGKAFGKIISCLYIFIAIQIASFTFNDFGSLYGNIILDDTPVTIIYIFFGLLCLWGVKEGIEVVGRITKGGVLVVLGLIILYSVFIISDADFNNLKPFLYGGMKPVLRGAFHVSAFPLGETFVFTMVLSSLDRKESINKVYLKGLLIGGLIILFSETLVIAILGYERYSSLNFPAFVASRLAGFGAFERIEVAGLFTFMLGNLVKGSICILGACKGIEKVFNLKDYRTIVAPIVITTIILTEVQFKSSFELAAWNSEIWPYYSFIFQVLIPVLLLIAIEINVLRRKKLGGNTNE